VRFTLSGIIPPVAQTQNITLTQIQETDGQGKPVPGTMYEYHTVVVNPGPPPHYPGITALGIFRSHIDEKIALGINTSLAEARYAEADIKTKSAKSRGPTQYQLAYADLDAAQKAIDEGERLLDKAWAEKEVADAQQKISDVDDIIGWFRANSSTANLVGLQPIVTKRDRATGYLAAANNEILAGRNSLARSDATLAFEAANESYNDAMKFRIGVNSCSDYFGPYADCNMENTILIAGAGIIALVLLVVCFFWWRKRKEAKYW
jgi:hypothetical protein